MNFGNTPGMNLFAQFAGGGLGLGLAGTGGAPPSAFDEHYRAYSMAMLQKGGKRDHLDHGGKILMPPSALARLSNLEVPDPWMFSLRNPANAAASTHAGVLEFITDEGCVHLPNWMMKTLKLQEGDPLRVTGASLPKGSFVKLQAQEVDFIEVSDPKAVLEQALRNFTCLTQGDIIEISYNSIVFGLLVMETKAGGTPGGEGGRDVPGISVLNTDLAVDFATPKGYKEPVRQLKPPALHTMADRLGLPGSGVGSASSSRPGSSMAVRPPTATGNAPGSVEESSGFEAFKGRGETLNGRKTKGKGKAGRKITEVAEGSKIVRTDKTKLITPSMLETDPAQADALPLRLPFGTLFFGYEYVPFVEEGEGQEKTEDQPAHDWGTGGNALGSRAVAAAAAPKPKKKRKPQTREIIDLD